MEPTLSAWRAERRGKGLDIGRPPEHDLRRIMEAVLYVDRTGIPWRYLPHDFAPWETVYGNFAAWQKGGVFDQLNGVLRRLVREAEGRDSEPSACVVDAQSVKTSAIVPAASQGIDAGKKIAGRKRHIGVDTLGLLLAVLVTAVSVSDNAGGIQVLSQIAKAHPRVTKPGPTPATAPQPSTTAPASVSTSKLSAATPTRRGSRSSRDAGSSSGLSAGSCTTGAWPVATKSLPTRSEAMIRLAMIDLMSRRLTRETTLNWRGT